jgi:hypothetical protein
MRLHRSAEALEDLGRANQLSPQAANVVELMTYGLLVTGKPTEALAEINLAEALEGPNPYERQLKSEIVASLNKHSRDTGASGN